MLHLLNYLPKQLAEYIKEKNIKGNMAHWNNCFDKLLIFGMTEFDKLIFLDSDMYIIENIDHLF